MHFPYTRPPSRGQAKSSSRRRISDVAWNRIRDEVSREHHGLTHSNPRSPRIRPTLASFVEVRR